MATTTVDRRASARLGAAAGLAGSILPGVSIVFANVSAGGALVWSARALRPGSRVQLFVVLDGNRIVVPATVVRCSVVSLSPHSVNFAAALAFEAPLAAFVLAPGSADPGRSGQPDPWRERGSRDGRQ